MQAMAVEYLTVLLVKARKLPLISSTGVSLLKVAPKYLFLQSQSLAFFEDDDISCDSLARMLDVHFLTLLNVSNEDTSAYNITSYNTSVLTVVKRFLQGHKNRDIQDVCLYGIPFVLI